MFGLSTLAIQAIAAAALAVGAFGAGVRWSNGQHAIAEVARQETVRIQAAAHRATERQQATQVQEATNAARKREILARAAADAAAGAAGRLRDDLADLQRRLPSASLDACREHAATIGAVFNACVAEYGSVARDADAHASDAMTLEQAWPRVNP